jgi:hypothetical protein
MEKYIKSTRKAFQSNNIEARVHRLRQTMEDAKKATVENIAEYHILDRQITEIMLAAEANIKKQPGGSYPWSPEYKEAQTLVRFWTIRQSQFRTCIDHSNRLTAMRHDLEEKHPEVRKTDLTRGQIEEYTRTALKKLKQVKAEALALREKYLQERAEFYGIMHHTPAEKALRGILLAETMTRKFRTIRSGLKGERSQGLDRVQVKNDNAGLPGEESHNWAITKDDVHSALQVVNPARFRGHSTTPFGHRERMQDIGSDCTSHSVKDILNGIYNFRLEELTTEQREWM